VAKEAARAWVHGSDQRAADLLPDVGAEKVESFDGDDGEGDTQTPVQVRPNDGPLAAEMKSIGKPFAKAGADQHHAQCQQHERPNKKRKTDGKGARLPVGARLGYVIGDVKGFDSGGEAGGYSPDRACQSDC
jgi:hypothetical protein